MDVQHRSLVVHVGCWLLLIGSVSAQTTPALPSSVAVADGVQLEVVDWGGRGRALVFLSGFGNTVHVFDEFAPQFTDRFRVIGITRRGFGASSRPPDGYAASRLSEDLLEALNALHLVAPILIGHSLAGDEMSAVAARQPNRVSALVYLDAAYDRTQPEMLQLASQLPPPPRASKDDLATRDTFQRFWFRTHAWTYPDSELDQYDKFGDPSSEIQQAILTSPQSPRYERITVPALAIYAIPRSGKEMFAAYDLVDRSAQSQIDAVWPKWAALVRREERRFRDGVRNGRVVEIGGGSHYLFFSHRSETTRAVREFLDTFVQSR